MKASQLKILALIGIGLGIAGVIVAKAALGEADERKAADLYALPLMATMAGSATCLVCAGTGAIDRIDSKRGKM